MKVYGIKNCNTVKKSLDWLKSNNIDVDFQDFKKVGASKEKLNEWIDRLGWEPLLNKKGTTWKQLGPAEQAKVTNREAAVELMHSKTSVIKRPVIEAADGLILGFDENTYDQTFNK